MIKLIKSTFLKEKETKKKLAAFIMRASILSMDKECKTFEASFAKKQEREHAVFVNSGSSANLLLIQALLNLGRLKAGDRVGFSALTWSTNVMPIIQLGLVPVAIDCEIETLNISPKTLAKHLPRIKALFLTNVLGFSDDIASIARDCKKAGVILLEDNCEALGSKTAGKRLGKFSPAPTFSFYVGQSLSTLEGRVAATDDKELASMLKMVRAHGWDRALPKEEKEKLRAGGNVGLFFALYTFYDLAYNLRPTEFQGFLGNLQIKYWDLIVSEREKNFNAFNKAAGRNPELTAISVSMDTVSNFSFPVIAKSRAVFEKYRARFEKAGVEIRPIIAGNIAKQPFYTKYVKERSECPNADFIHQNAFYFGNNPELTAKEVKTLSSLLLP